MTGLTASGEGSPIATTPTATDFSTSTSTHSKRIKGTTLSIPFRYGCEAIPITDRDRATAQGIDPSHTHRWRVFLEPLVPERPEDLSTFVEKVQFQLHESFAQSKRVISVPPYQVEETGWGEFEVPIKIFFRDPLEKPVTVIQHLHLFTHPPANSYVVRTPSDKGGDEILKYERYEELVFHDPSEFMTKLHETHLQQKGKKAAVGPKVFSKSRGMYWSADFELVAMVDSEFEQKEMAVLTAASATIKKQLSEQQTKYKKMTDACVKLRQQIADFQQQRQQTAFIGSSSTEESDLYGSSTDMEEEEEDLQGLSSATDDDGEFHLGQAAGGTHKKKSVKKKTLKRVQE